MIVLVGKSASGKSTVEAYLKEQLGYDKIISYTTRPMRKGEVDGVDYHFITKPEFLKRLNDNFFAEFVENYGNYYGVAKEDCTDNTVAVVEKHGLKQLKENADINIASFYLHESFLERFKRLYKRGDKLSLIFKRLVVDNFKFIGAERECDYTIKSENVETTARLIEISAKNFLEVYKNKMKGENNAKS